jgi:hypothetical protein
VDLIDDRPDLFGEEATGSAVPPEFRDEHGDIRCDRHAASYGDPIHLS